MSRVLFLLLISLFPSSVSSQILVLKDKNEIQSVAKYARVFLDSSGSLSPEDLIGPEYTSKFRPIQGEYENLNVREESVWIYFRISQQSNERHYLKMYSPLANQVFLYSRTKQGWSKAVSGTDFPIEEHAVKVNDVIFPLVESSNGDTIEYFVNVRSCFPVVIAFETGTAPVLWEAQYYHSIFAGVFFGIMLIMALYNLFLFLTNGDRVYIYYSLYVFFTVLFISACSGFIVIFPGVVRTLTRINFAFPIILFGSFGVLFTMRFLRTKEYAAVMHRILIGLMCITTVIFLIGFFKPHLSTILIQVCGTLLSTISLITGFLVWRAGYKPARYYLLGFGTYMIGLVLYIGLGVMGIDAGLFTPPRILMATSAIEAIILSFAIGDKLNIAVRDKQLAQEKTMDALLENEKIISEQNIVLEKKVEERTSEIQHQKAVIEEKNKDILDSIHYAKRIQGALLASDMLLQKNLPEYFILYRPKDIVSGDFYWANEMEDGSFLLLTGDCTGHGVPGAFMSLLNISILHEQTNALKKTQPDEILNSQRDAIVMSLNPVGTEDVSRDGMDCVLCRFDFARKKLDFACANNPLWVLRNNELLEFKGDKFPIGISGSEKKDFTLQELELQSGDTVYTFTDGFADQFGGPRGKKFKYSQLKEILKSTASLPLHVQKEKIEAIFESWKGNLSQVDDVLLIGVRIP
jgi:two-component system, sensor histidine kinase LadS